jgi:hypothetical protein
MKLNLGGHQVEVEVRAEEEIADSGSPIVTLRVEEGVYLAEGAMVTQCSKCGHDVWISPSSARIHAQGGNPIWCMQCAADEFAKETPEKPAVQ